ncbi:MAG TPA: nucleotidyltransferase domain-containing protein [Thermodesulfovibrionales bacterium]|nr:nucleotidyltransferase domain-containing protein [Thermodesulfovibrionales bacterium]
MPVPEGIIAVYVYGSILGGRLRVESDIDIAILPSYGVDDPEKLRLIAEIEGIVTSALKKIGVNTEVSVLDLRARYVSLQLLYIVVTEGALLYERGISERLEFENTVKRDFFDFEPYLMHLRKRKYGDILQKA